MDTTLVSSKGKVVIGPDRPFILIGERINPTGRKKLAAEISAGNLDRVRADAEAQVRAGAAVLDVNAGVPGADEASLLRQIVLAVQDVVDVPVSVDSSIAEALEAALPACKGKALVNSVTGEDDRLERVLPLVKKYGAAVIGLAHDESGISMLPEDRLRAARKIIARAADHGIPAEDVLIDPLVLAVGAEPRAAELALETIRLVRGELGVNLTCGASNVSFGMPDRDALNAAFLPMAMATGLTSAITNPLVQSIRMAVRAGDVLLGHDPYGMAWMKDHRDRTLEPTG